MDRRERWLAIGELEQGLSDFRRGVDANWGQNAADFYFDNLFKGDARLDAPRDIAQKPEA